MRQSLLVAVACLLLQTACSSSPNQTRVRTQSIGSSEVGRLAVTTTVEADLIRVPFDADAVFRVLPAAYDSLGIPIHGMNPARKTVSNDGIKIRNRLGRTPLSMYLDCGNSQIGPNADSYDVYLTVSTTVTPGASGTAAMATMLEAQARPATYNQAYHVCSSKGVLEQKLADQVKARLIK